MAIVLSLVAATAVAARQPFDPFGPSFAVKSMSKYKPTVGQPFNLELYGFSAGDTVTLCGGDLAKPTSATAAASEVMMLTQTYGWPVDSPMRVGVCINGVPVRSAVPYTRPDEAGYSLFALEPSTHLPRWYATGGSAFAPRLPFFDAEIPVRLTGSLSALLGYDGQVGMFVHTEGADDAAAAAAASQGSCPVAPSALQHVAHYSDATADYTVKVARPEGLSKVHVGFCFLRSGAAAWSVLDGTSTSRFLTVTEASASAGRDAVLYAVRTTGSVSSVHAIRAEFELLLPQLGTKRQTVSEARLVKAGHVVAQASTGPDEFTAKMKAYGWGAVDVEVYDGAKWQQAFPLATIDAAPTEASFPIGFDGFYTVATSVQEPTPYRFMETSLSTTWADDLSVYISASADCNGTVPCYNDLSRTATKPCGPATAHLDFVVKGNGNEALYVCAKNVDGTATPLSTYGSPLGVVSLELTQPQYNISFGVVGTDAAAKEETFANFPLPEPFNLTIKPNPEQPRGLEVFVTTDELGCLMGPDGAVDGGEPRLFTDGWRNDSTSFSFHNLNDTETAAFCVGNSSIGYLWLAAYDQASHVVPMGDSTGHKISVVLLVALGAGGLLLLVLVACYVRRRMRRRSVEECENLTVQEETRLI